MGTSKRKSVANLVLSHSHKRSVLLLLLSLALGLTGGRDSRVIDVDVRRDTSGYGPDGYNSGVHRFLQTQCSATQFVNSTTNRCQNCDASCLSCNSPLGSCQYCNYVAPSITYPAAAQANAALCTSNAQNCRYSDPFCLGTCAGANNGGICQSCIKGTVPTPIPDSNNNN